MTAHTPGPWEVGASGVSPLAVCTGHRVLAQVNVTGYKCAAAEDTANARLIAAAPELLEALAAIVDRLSAWEEGARISGDDNARVNYSLLCGTAYAAIAKATGGSI